MVGPVPGYQYIPERRIMSTVNVKQHPDRTQGWTYGMEARSFSQEVKLHSCGLF